MIVLLDTNVILDALMERGPFDIDAKEILIRAQNGDITCLFTANAATDIFYLYSKARDIITAKTALNFLLSKYGVVSVTQEDCINALTFSIDDFEDALVAACAKKANVDYVVTRDDRFIRESPVKATTPKELLEQLRINKP
jgi:predicted nucleic acid-binding protein